MCSLCFVPRCLLQIGLSDNSFQLDFALISPTMITSVRLTYVHNHCLITPLDLGLEVIFCLCVCDLKVDSLSRTSFTRSCFSLSLCLSKLCDVYSLSLKQKYIIIYSRIWLFQACFTFYL